MNYESQLQKSSVNIKYANPNQVQTQDIYKTESDIYIVMELCDKDQDLGYFIDEKYFNMPKVVVTEKEAIMILDNILQGVMWLQKLNIIHRDIK